MSRNKWIDEWDDLETPAPEEETGSSLSESLNNLGQLPYLTWIAAGLFAVLIVLGVAFWAGDGDQPPPADLTPLTARLDSLESRVSQLASELDQIREQRATSEPNAQSQTIQDLGMQIQNLENAFTRFKKQTSSTLASLRSRIESQTGASSQEQSRPASGSSDSGSATYTVKQGDNLFRIGLKFGVSVEQLRAWNNLQPQDEIFPGQKLRVSSP